jgi:hypothetical protein
MPPVNWRWLARQGFIAKNNKYREQKPAALPENM